MFAIVESGSITSYTKGNRGVQIGSVKHSADIFTSKWTESERNAIGVYTIEIDESNKKNEKWYINTDITYAFSGGKVKDTGGVPGGKYGSPRKDGGLMFAKGGLATMFVEKR